MTLSSRSDSDHPPSSFSSSSPLPCFFFFIVHTNQRILTVDCASVQIPGGKKRLGKGGIANSSLTMASMAATTNRNLYDQVAPHSSSETCLCPALIDVHSPEIGRSRNNYGVPRWIARHDWSRCYQSMAIMSLGYMALVGTCI
jgi:hypothetical protein